MRNLSFFFIFALSFPFLLGFSMNGKSEWRKIVPMVSTKDDVERELRNPKKEKEISKNLSEGLSEDELAFLAEYEIEDGKIRVAYSDGNCKDDANLYYAPKWTVIEVLFIPDEPFEFAKLNLNLEKFKAKQHGTGTSCGVNFLTYTNEEDGTIYKVEDDEVEMIVIKPTANYVNLRCDNFLQSKDNR